MTTAVADDRAGSSPDESGRALECGNGACDEGGRRETHSPVAQAQGEAETQPWSCWGGLDEILEAFPPWCGPLADRAGVGSPGRPIQIRSDGESGPQRPLGLPELSSREGLVLGICPGRIRPADLLRISSCLGDGALWA
jgi:hypothetical protein